MCPPVLTLPIRQAGLTLLELLLVVAILSAVAFMSLSQVTDDVSQARYEDTVNRLEALRDAIVGRQDAVYSGQLLHAGYAADNGLIPTNARSIDTLLIQPTRTNQTDAAFDVYASQSPIFDPEPIAATGYNNGTSEVTLGESNETLQKGWRGSYLVMQPGMTTFTDGWGTDTGNADNGWDVTTATDGQDITITSFGRDAVAGVALASPWDDDLSVQIAYQDWALDTNNWQVAIENKTGVDIDLSTTGTCLRLSLLVYRNQDTANTNGRWKRLTSDCLAGSSGAANTNESCLDGNGDGSVASGICSSSQAVSFTQSDYDDGFESAINIDDTRVPQGRHLLMVIVDDISADIAAVRTPLKHSDAAGADSLDTPCILGTGCVSTSRTTYQVDFFAKASLPSVTVSIAN